MLSVRILNPVLRVFEILDKAFAMLLPRPQAFVSLDNVGHSCFYDLGLM